ncbi:DUF4868 domain-containing protein [Enterococcus faecium]|nr:DUF4868 domain-containing protein [Enterococcus faecium]ERK34945.1 hypothetical protein I131_13350 [Enterococcus faecium CRL1879]AGE29397.1 hypothetical protein M7W_758 [Enterococcus faecium ATCC 8459 = NRRL B-2354]EHU5000145.1 DUF4868 domain-containing protein [Enterococcus faecium]EOH66809.1 hypothetical protein UAG_02682 [Enterococcus faecium ATCC 8459 = NRRL B-2354]EOU08028.1 hypothetical protein I581_00010 [Enterococcus faecium ATCC 8459 = NRRL B-2354]
MSEEYATIKAELIERLESETEEVTDYLETDKNIYVMDTNVQTNVNVFIKQAIEKLEASELIGFDVYKDSKESISLISDENKLKNLTELPGKFASAQEPETNIFENKEKIKYFYIKFQEIVLVYRYTQRAYLKSKAFIKIGKNEVGHTKELQLVTEEDDRISLDKQWPDLVYDMADKRAFLFNSKQSEYIIDLEVEITKTKKSFPDIQKENAIFTEGSYPLFEEAISYLNKTKVRKFVKMIENKTYQKFVDNRDKALGIKQKYNFSIYFNEYNEIIFNDDTSMEDILHLLSDDYVQSYLDEESMVRDE